MSEVSPVPDGTLYDTMWVLHTVTPIPTVVVTCMIDILIGLYSVDGSYVHPYG